MLNFPKIRLCAVFCSSRRADRWHLFSNLQSFPTMNIWVWFVVHTQIQGVILPKFCCQSYVQDSHLKHGLVLYFVYVGAHISFLPGKPMPLWIRICLPENHLHAQSLTLLPYSLPICAEVRTLFVNCCCYPHLQQDREEKKKKKWSGDKSKEKPWKKNFIFIFLISIVVLSYCRLFFKCNIMGHPADIDPYLVDSLSPFLFLSLDFWHINKEHCPGFSWTEKFK